MVIYGFALWAALTLGSLTPLLNDGAPISGLIALLPYQASFLLPYILPLAVCAGTIAPLARMRQDGEIQALAASGIASTRLLSAQFPIIMMLAITYGWILHDTLPATMRDLRVNTALLAKQGISSQVARQEPIFDEGDTVLTALFSEDNTLGHLIGWHFDPQTQERSLIYAPQATWAFDATLWLQANEARVLRLGPNQETEISYGTFPSISYPLRFEDTVEKQKNKPDTMATSELHSMHRQALEHLTALEAKPLPHSRDHQRTIKRERRQVRNIELSWHQRWNGAFDIIALWLFSAVIALRFSIRNQATTIAIAIGLLILIEVPAIAGAKGSGKYLTFSTGYLVWPPGIILGCLSMWFLWRRTATP